MKTFINDPEVVEALADDPELLAIADVVAATQHAPASIPPHVARISRKRLLIGVAIATVALLIPLGGIAGTHGWWFDPDQGMTPAGSIAVLQRGVKNGAPWAAAAYTTVASSDTCLYIGAPNEVSSLNGDIGCGSLRGLTTREFTSSNEGWLTYLHDGDNDITVGGTAAQVARVEAVHVDGHVSDVPLIDAPAALDSPVRFFVLPEPGDIISFRAFDDQGKLLFASR